MDGLCVRKNENMKEQNISSTKINFRTPPFLVFYNNFLPLYYH